MNERRRLIGIVKSDKMQETVVVEISRTFRHPLYKKVVHTSKRVKAHDTMGCKVGDEVQIVESRPLSADKRWVVETVIKRQGEPAIEIVDVIEELKQEEKAADKVEEETEEETEVEQEDTTEEQEP